MEITLVRSLFDDIIYVDDKKVLQKENIRAEDVLKCLNENYSRIFIAEEKLQEIGELPNDLSDLKKLLTK